MEQSAVQMSDFIAAILSREVDGDMGKMYPLVDLGGTSGNSTPA